MTDWSLVGGDPAPGDPEGVRAFARDLDTVAEDAEESRRQLNRIRDDWQGAIWKGRAADAFRGSIDDLPADLEKLFTSYGMARDALRAYASSLDSSQDQARTALGRAQEAAGAKGRAEADEQRAGGDRSRAERDRASLEASYRTKRVAYEARRLASLASGHHDPSLAASYHELQQLRSRIGSAGDAVVAARSAQSAAQGRVATADQSLRAARSLAGQAAQLRQTAADRARQKVEEASDAGIKNRNWFQRAVEFGEKLLTGDPDAWATLVERLKTVANVLSVAALLLGWVPILGQVLAVTALVVSGLVLVGTAVLWANGRASGWDVLLAGVDVGLSVVGARTALLKGGTSLSGQGIKTAFKKGVVDKLKSGARKYTRLMTTMRNPSVKGFRRVVVGFSENAGAAKRAFNYRDARRAQGWMRDAYVISREKLPTVLLKRGKDILELGRDIDEGGFDQARDNALLKVRKGTFDNLDPTPGYVRGIVDQVAPDLFGEPSRQSSIQLPGHPRVTLPAAA